MKKTRIKIRAYCNDFEIEVSRKDAYLNIEEAEKYVKKEIIDTSEVISVTYLSDGKEQTFHNISYKDPSLFITSESGRAIQYIKTKP